MRSIGIYLSFFLWKMFSIIYFFRMILINCSKVLLFYKNFPTPGAINLPFGLRRQISIKKMTSRENAKVIEHRSLYSQNQEVKQEKTGLISIQNEMIWIETIEKCSKILMSRRDWRIWKILNSKPKTKMASNHNCFINNPNGTPTSILLIQLKETLEKNPIHYPKSENVFLLPNKKINILRTSNIKDKKIRNFILHHQSLQGNTKGYDSLRRVHWAE